MAIVGVRIGSLALAFAAGMGLSLLYFAGLWQTVRMLSEAHRPVLVAISSMVLRSAILVGGFALISGQRPERWALCLVGFLLARGVAVWASRRGERRRPVEG